MKNFQKMIAAVLFSVSFLHCAEDSYQSKSKRTFNKELAHIRKKYTDVQLKKLDEASQALEELSELGWHLHNIRSVGRPYNKKAIREKKAEIDKQYLKVKKIVEHVVRDHSIHPDDIGIPQQWYKPDGQEYLRRRLLWCCEDSFPDVDFTRFLLMHGADPNDPELDLLSGSIHSLPIAITLIAHGTHVGSFRNYHGGTLFHQLRMLHKNSPDLALLYYLHGADPQIVDEFGKTPLIQLAWDVAEGSYFDPRWHNTERNTKRCFKLASNLIKIGVPLDAAITKECTSYNFSKANPGDCAMSILFNAQSDTSKDTHWDKDYLARIFLFKKNLLDAQAEVDEAKKKHIEALSQTLEQLLPAYGPRTIIKEYAQEHVVPPSIKEDLKRIREQNRKLREKFDREESRGAVILPCIVS